MGNFRFWWRLGICERRLFSGKHQPPPPHHRPMETPVYRFGHSYYGSQYLTTLRRASFDGITSTGSDDLDSLLQSAEYLPQPLRQHDVSPHSRSRRPSSLIAAHLHWLYVANNRLRVFAFQTTCPRFSTVSIIILYRVAVKSLSPLISEFL